MRRVPGSARVSRAGEGVFAIANFSGRAKFMASCESFKRLLRRDAEASTRDACATRSEERYQSFRELWQLIPSHRALSFFAPQMRLCEQFTEIFVTGAIFDQHGQNAAIFHRQFAADDWSHVVFARGDRKSLRAVNAVAIA